MLPATNKVFDITDGTMTTLMPSVSPENTAFDAATAVEYACTAMFDTSVIIGAKSPDNDADTIENCNDKLLAQSIDGFKLLAHSTAGVRLLAQSIEGFRLLAHMAVARVCEAVCMTKNVCYRYVV